MRHSLSRMYGMKRVCTHTCGNMPTRNSIFTETGKYEAHIEPQQYSTAAER